MKQKRSKLLDLYYADRISGEGFEEEERRLSMRLRAIEEAEQERTERAAQRSELAERFEEVAELLASVDITTVWDEADEKERRVLVEDLVDAVYVFPDHLRVVACGAPPLKVELTEVGLHPPAGMGTFVSEGRPRRFLPLLVCGLGSTASRSAAKGRQVSVSSCGGFASTIPRWRLTTS